MSFKQSGSAYPLIPNIEDFLKGVHARSEELTASIQKSFPDLEVEFLFGTSSGDAAKKRVTSEDYKSLQKAYIDLLQKDGSSPAEITAAKNKFSEVFNDIQANGSIADMESFAVGGNNRYLVGLCLDQMKGRGGYIDAGAGDKDFIILHELGHVVDAEKFNGLDKTDPQKEIFADAFAAFMLKQNGDADAFKKIAAYRKKENDPNYPFHQFANQIERSIGTKTDLKEVCGIIDKIAQSHQEKRAAAKSAPAVSLPGRVRGFVWKWTKRAAIGVAGIILVTVGYNWISKKSNSKPAPDTPYVAPTNLLNKGKVLGEGGLKKLPPLPSKAEATPAPTATAAPAPSQATDGAAPVAPTPAAPKITGTQIALGGNVTCIPLYELRGDDGKSTGHLYYTQVTDAQNTVTEQHLGIIRPNGDVALIQNDPKLIALGEAIRDCDGKVDVIQANEAKGLFVLYYPQSKLLVTINKDGSPFKKDGALQIFPASEFTAAHTQALQSAPGNWKNQPTKLSGPRFDSVLQGGKIYGDVFIDTAGLQFNVEKAGDGIKRLGPTTEQQRIESLFKNHQFEKQTGPVVYMPGKTDLRLMIAVANQRALSIA